MSSDGHHHDDDARQQPAEPAQRSLLKGALLTAGGAVGLARHQRGAIEPAAAQARQSLLVAATDQTVHWGYFGKLLKPVIEVDSGDFVTIEALTHHSIDDAERMVKGDPGRESFFRWDKSGKGVDRRGAAPIDASVFGRGAGEGSASIS